jgi:hypothetical protein
MDLFTIFAQLPSRGMSSMLVCSIRQGAFPLFEGLVYSCVTAGPADTRTGGELSSSAGWCIILVIPHNTGIAYFMQYRIIPILVSRYPL